MAPDAFVAFGEGDADGVGVSCGVAEDSAVVLGDGVGLTLGEGDGVGDDFFPFFFGDADGELSAVDVGEASGVALAVGLGFGEGVGVVFFLGEGLGDEVFFADVESFFFFGGGVGSKRRLIFVPKSWARDSGGAIAPNAIAEASRIRRRVLNARIPARWLCSTGFPLRGFRAGSSR